LKNRFKKLPPLLSKSSALVGELYVKRTFFFVRTEPTNKAKEERWKMETADVQLVELIADEVARDGGLCFLQHLPLYNPSIRRLLGDRKVQNRQLLCLVFF
jgi:hypothetical protein